MVTQGLPFQFAYCILIYQWHHYDCSFYMVIKRHGLSHTHIPYSKMAKSGNQNTGSGRARVLLDAMAFLENCRRNIDEGRADIAP